MYILYAHVYDDELNWLFEIPSAVAMPIFKSKCNNLSETCTAQAYLGVVGLEMGTYFCVMAISMGRLS